MTHMIAKWSARSLFEIFTSQGYDKHSKLLQHYQCNLMQVRATHAMHITHKINKNTQQSNKTCSWSWNGQSDSWIHETSEDASKVAKRLTTSTFWNSKLDVQLLVWLVMLHLKVVKWVSFWNSVWFFWVQKTEIKGKIVLKVLYMAHWHRYLRIVAHKHISKTKYHLKCVWNYWFCLVQSWKDYPGKLNFPDQSLHQGQLCRFQPPSVNVDLSFAIICHSDNVDIARS